MSAVAVRPVEIAKKAIRIGAVQKEPELSALLTLLQDCPPAHVLEIGTDRGGTLQAWCDVAAPIAVIMSVDIPNGAWVSSESVPTQRQPKQIVKRLHGLSGDADVYEIVERYAPYDFLFIDGDHSAVGSGADYIDYVPLVNTGGLIAFHDICIHPSHTGIEVYRTWETVRKAASEWWEFISPPEHWGGIGVIRKDAA